ncbi:MAG TPA: PAS domain S-box protein [Rhodocyclaceae bacterium]|nr:PAS domain S-box protein [Rhodocyclaceae bacterium]
MPYFDKLLWFLITLLALAVAGSTAIPQAESLLLLSTTALLFAFLVAAFRLGQRHPAADAGNGPNPVVARLQSEQSVLRTFFRALPDMAWIKDAEGRYLACNPLFEEFCGIKEDQLIGKTDFALVDEQLATFFRQKDQEAIQAGSPRVNEEWVTYASDGRRALLETVKAPIRDADGRPIAVLGIGHDLTAYRQLEESLRDTHHFLDQVIDNIADPIFVKDRQHRWVHINEAGCRLLGAPREELIGRSEVDYLHPDEVRVCWEGDNIVFNTGRDYSNEERTIAADGTPRHFTTRKSLITTSHGEPLVVATISEITEHRELQEALRASRHILAEAQRIAHIGSWQMDLPDGRMEWSDEVFRILELDPDNTTACRDIFLARVHPDDRDGLQHCHSRCLSRQASSDTEHRLLMPDGRIKHVHQHCETFFSDDGRPLRSVGTIQDVTADREAAERLEESRRLLQEFTAHREEVREEERRRIARNLHEELGQLLGSLRMGLSVQRVWTDPAAFREKLPALLSQVDQVIDGLREAVAELRPNPLNMGIIPALEWLVLDFTESNGIECTFHGIEGVDLPDQRATALFRIVQESLANVARHSGADRAAVFLEQDEANLILRVKDEGRGFDPLTHRPKTFGLLGIRERSLMLGGHLDIRSTPGQGTEIVLRFPA